MFNVESGLHQCSTVWERDIWNISAKGPTLKYICMFSSGGHIGWKAVIVLKGDHIKTIQVFYLAKWFQRSFSNKILLKYDLIQQTFIKITNFMVKFFFY